MPSPQLDLAKVEWSIIAEEPTEAGFLEAMGPDGARWGPGLRKLTRCSLNFHGSSSDMHSCSPCPWKPPGSFFLPFAPICTLQNLHFQMFQSRQRWHGRVMGM